MPKADYKNRQRTAEKVAAAYAKNPLASQMQIAKVAGVDQGTVSRIMPSLPLLKDERIRQITDKDYKVVQLTLKHTIDILEDPDKYVNITARDLAYIGEVSARRYSLLSGAATDAKGGLVAPEAMNFYLNRTETINNFNEFLEKPIEISTE